MWPDCIATLKRLSAEASGQYDDTTANAVRAIQTVTALVVDGKVGKQTRMILVSWLPDHETPSLQPKDTPARIQRANFKMSDDDVCEWEEQPGMLDKYFMQAASYVAMWNEHHTHDKIKEAWIVPFTPARKSGLGIIEKLDDPFKFFFYYSMFCYVYDTFKYLLENSNNSLQLHEG